MTGARPYSALVMGGSAGGVAALAAILPHFPADFTLPVLVVQHLHASDDGSFARHLARMTRLVVVEPCDKERIKSGHLYTAPANYHLLVEKDNRISLSVDEKVNWSRPSIDVLFMSAARAWQAGVIAVILSGANADGAQGILAVKKVGGVTIAQAPVSAATPVMPQAAIDAGGVNEVLITEDIGSRLVALGTYNPDIVF